MAAQADVIHVPLDRDGIDPAGLADALERCERDGRPAKLVYVIPTFQNPSGAALSLERRAAVLELAVRHDVLVVEDDPYARAALRGRAAAVAAQHGSRRPRDLRRARSRRCFSRACASATSRPTTRSSPSSTCASRPPTCAARRCRSGSPACSSTIRARSRCSTRQRDVYRARRDALAGALATRAAAGLELDDARGRAVPVGHAAARARHGRPARALPLAAGRLRARARRLPRRAGRALAAAELLGGRRGHPARGRPPPRRGLRRGARARDRRSRRRAAHAHRPA